MAANDSEESRRPFEQPVERDWIATKADTFLKKVTIIESPQQLEKLEKANKKLEKKREK